MAARGRFVKRDFTDLGQIPERLLKMSQMGLQCVYWMDFTLFEVLMPYFETKMAARERLLFTITFFFTFFFS